MASKGLTEQTQQIIQRLVRNDGMVGKYKG
jgi:hypothetical protein